LLDEIRASEGVFKRYFPVILKPIILTLLFFVAIVWVYLALSTVSSVWFLDPDFTPEVKAEETARASNLGSFLMNMFRGNFGYSSQTLAPVWHELAWRFPTTLLLVGLSIIFSVLIGMGLSMLFKPGKQKPCAFAHSLKGFFFGLVPFIAMPLMLFFCYYLYINFGFKVFPLSGLHSVPPPTDPIAYVSDMLWHLFLPVTTLTLIGVVRILFVIWSSGSTFTERALLKKILLPCTTFDFAVLISAVIVVEWFWTLPGLGRLLLNSLMAADYNAFVGAFVMIVGLAVGFGYMSVILDFIQGLIGLREDLEKKAATEPKINPTSTKEASTKNIKPFWRRKAFVVGSAVVIAFLILAAFAPFVTPHDPFARERIAEDFAMPRWMTVFPQFRDYPTTRDYVIYWDVEQGQDFTKSWGASVVVEYEAEAMEMVDVEFSANFSYNEIPPNSFYFKFEWNASDVASTEYSLRITLLTPEGENRTSYLLWIQAPLRTMKSEIVEVNSRDPFFIHRLGFEPPENPAPIIFSQKGEYTLQLKMQFNPMSENARCKMNFENAQFVIPGRVHGVLGCDNTGADLFSQLAYGARTAVILVFPTAILAVILGFQFGFLAGYFQGWADNVITPIFDMVLCLPILPIVLVNAFPYGMSWFALLPISLLFLSALATRAFRNTFLIRPSNQKLKGNTPAEKGLNVFKDFVANFCLTAISLLLLLPIVEFLGFYDPTVISWGKMLHHAYGFGALPRLAWWWILPPAICIVLFSLGLFLMGTGLEDERL